MIQVDAEFHDVDEFEEVDVEEVGLRAVGLPERGRAGGEEGGDAAAGFVGADGPGGEGGDFAEVGVDCWAGRAVSGAVG